MIVASTIVPSQQQPTPARVGIHRIYIFAAKPCRSRRWAIVVEPGWRRAVRPFLDNADLRVFTARNGYLATRLVPRISVLSSGAAAEMRNLLAAGAFLSALILGTGNVHATTSVPVAGEHSLGRLLPVNGTRLWVETEGSGEPLIVLVGGPANSHVSLHPAFSALSDRFQVIYYDYRGRGRSDAAAAKEVTFARDVEDLEALRRALGLTRVHIYGFSYGGLVAQAYALAHPDRVNRLVLANTLYSARMWKLNHDNINLELQRQYPEVWERIETLRAKGARSSDAEMQQLFAVHGPLIRWYNPDKAQRLRKEPGSVNKALYWEFVGENIDFDIGGEVSELPDFRPRLRELRMPTLILAGRFDRALYPQLQMDFKRYCPQATFVMLEYSGSYGHVEEPETVIPMVRDFLTAPAQ